ncbi:hypothetical protein EsH8_II_001494 [Colletotrichum jinshuiense]
MDDGENPPPSYTEATSPSPNPAARAPPFPRPSSTETHYVNLIPGTSPIAFPYPEPSTVWLSRDVRHDDWAAFTAALVGVAGPRNAAHVPVDLKGQDPISTEDTRELDHDEQVGRMRDVLASWNSTFFEPRGLRVLEGQSDDKASSSSPVPVQESKSPGDAGKKWNFGPDKFGIQIGGALLGVDVSKPTPEKK